MHQPLISLGFASKDPVVKQARHIGYKYVNDVETICNTNVSNNLNLYSKTSHVLTKTGIKEVDEHHGLGGLQPGTIIEFLSLPHVDKTGICFNIIAQYILSNYLQDNNKCVIFITTFGSYSKIKIIEMLKTHPNYQRMKPSISKLLDKIIVADCLDLNDLITSVYMLSSLAKEIGLLIIDGMFIHLKDIELCKQYTYKFAVTQNCLKEMKKLAQKKGFPIVVTNNYRIEQSTGKSNLLPYLGERYTQFINCRVHFEDKNNVAYVVKLELN